MAQQPGAAVSAGVARAKIPGELGEERHGEVVVQLEEDQRVLVDEAGSNSVPP